MIKLRSFATVPLSDSTFESILYVDYLFAFSPGILVSKAYLKIAYESLNYFNYYAFNFPE